MISNSLTIIMRDFYNMGEEAININFPPLQDINGKSIIGI
jgi:hypothetical protein